MSFDVNDLRTAVTLVSLAVFAGICAWAWALRNRSRFEEAAALPFQSE
ncbi:cbb3-type cytochrome c oxidase subunit 3 [Aquabacterium sp. A7-Y]|nr:cbb3-type cytochrome c oxidase subunit 3 [Aquabacterium sp. A7-Y]MCW7537777.1 cbb3-type cytochrome c oxidase subunit 3 [Aquabacterium sp. A7-Y]